MKNVENRIILIVACGKRFIKQKICSHRYHSLCHLSHYDPLAKKDIVEFYEYTCTKCGKHLVVRMDEEAQGAIPRDC